MRPLPHDIDDLRLAPLLLQAEDRLQELGALTAQDLRYRVALDADVPDWDEPHRREGVLRAIARDLDLGGWSLSWDPRGVRVAHGGHSVVLGVPASVLGFVAGDAAVQSR